MSDRYDFAEEQEGFSSRKVVEVGYMVGCHGCGRPMGFEYEGECYGCSTPLDGCNHYCPVTWLIDPEKLKELPGDTPLVDKWGKPDGTLAEVLEEFTQKDKYPVQDIASWWY